MYERQYGWIGSTQFGHVEKALNKIILAVFCNYIYSFAKSRKGRLKWYITSLYFILENFSLRCLLGGLGPPWSYMKNSKLSNFHGIFYFNFPHATCLPPEIKLNRIELNYNFIVFLSLETVQNKHNYERTD